MGPAKEEQAERLDKAWQRGESSFSKDYNSRLYKGLLLLCLATGVLFRFAVKLALLEMAGWAGFLFLVGLEMWPHLQPGGGSMYDSRAWKCTVQLWEFVMWALFGFDLAWLLWLGVLLGALMWRLGVRRAAAQLLQQKRKKGAVRQGRSELDASSSGQAVRDLDV